MTEFIYSVPEDNELKSSAIPAFAFINDIFSFIGIITDWPFLPHGGIWYFLITGKFKIISAAGYNH